MLDHVAVTVDGNDLRLLYDPLIGSSPWSPDGSSVVLGGGSANAYRIVRTDPTDPDFGGIIDAGPMLGRNSLGWSGTDRLLWYDRDAGALIETDLSGEPVIAPIAIRADGEIQSVVTAPMDGS